MAVGLRSSSWWRRPWPWVDLAVKGALIALLALAVLGPDLPQFEGKAMEGRALTYPVATIVVPLSWWVFAREQQFPFAIDTFLVLPFLIDIAGNALDLYDQVWWWDDVNHFVNWAFLAAAVTLAVLPSRLPAWATIGFGCGMGAVTAILWEVAEYFTFIRNSPELDTAYTDTLGDLSLGLTGSLCSAVIVVAWQRYRVRGAGRVGV